MMSLILAPFFAAFSLLVLIVVIKVLAWFHPAYGFLVEPVFWTTTITYIVYAIVRARTPR